jgi:hypothetical protein
MMKKTLIGWTAASFILAAAAAVAENATLHGQVLHHEGSAIHMRNFDVTLDGRTLTATEGVYHPEMGIVDLSGNVQLHFSKSARSFPNEVR